MAKALGWLANEHDVITDRIQTASLGLPVAFTITSARCPTPNVTTLVVYGSTGTKSYAITWSE